MSSAYAFRKVYADLIRPDGGVVVVYLNEVHLAGNRTTRASAERYEPDGTRTLFNGIEDVPELHQDDALDRLWVPLEGGRAQLHIEVEHGPWQPSLPSPVKPLHWEVLAARTRARLTWPDGRVDEGIGYVDWVDISVPTRLLGLRHLWWGRAHLPDRTLIFEWLDHAGGSGWHVAAELHPGGSIEHTPAAPRPADDGHLDIQLDSGSLSFAPDRVLHDGAAFDAERVPRWLDRKACELIGGPTLETRWQGTATHGGATGRALWEHVRFGPAAL